MIGWNIAVSQLSVKSASLLIGAFYAFLASELATVKFSGHGREDTIELFNGALVGIDNTSFVTAVQLRKTLDKIPGRKVIIIDACYSGALIGRGSITRTLNEKHYNNPAESFMNSFFSMRSTNKFESSAYYVMTAARGAEESFETGSEDKRYGIFSYVFCLGCG